MSLNPNQFSQPELLSEEEKGPVRPPDEYTGKTESQKDWTARGHRWQHTARSAPVAIRALGQALPGIAKTGDIRTVHETGVSGGGGTEKPARTGYLGKRTEMEQERGWSSPVYGYMDTPGMQHRTSMDYGAAKFTLNSSMEDRVSVTQGDSLNEWAAGEPVDPKPLSAFRAGAALPGPRLDYTEAQIHPAPGQSHSRVSLDDVTGLEMRHHSEDGVQSEMVRAADPFHERGIPVTHSVLRGDYQPPLPFSGDELKEQGFESKSWSHGGRLTRPAKPGGYGRPENISYRRETLSHEAARGS